jgi:hypothetical protein
MFETFEVTFAMRIPPLDVNESRVQASPVWKSKPDAEFFVP